MAGTRDEGDDRSSRTLGNGVLIGRPFGIPVFVSPSWLLVAVLITYTFGPYVESHQPGIGAWKWAVSFAYAVFLLLSVLVHELSHSVVALRLGLEVRQITLWLLGGVSTLDEPDTPRKEFLVAAAGPAASIVIAGVSFGLFAALPDGSVPHLLAGQLAFVNAIVAAFNLLPGLPLDGGAIVRSAVWKIARRRSTGTVAAAWAGRGLAVVVVFAAAGWGMVTGNGQPGIVDIVWGGLIAMFLWSGATQVLRVQQVRSRLPRAQARTLLRPALSVPGDLPLGEAIRRARESGMRALVVTDSTGHPTGIVNESAVVATPQERWPWVAVSALSKSLDDSVVLTADLDGEELIKAMQRKPAPEYLVVEPGSSRLAGVLATADVERAVSTG
ncbi:MAG: site-2 protease family protein [Streptosporangiales bacterium]|nr:site-2 protease family protein [Streptosporangiales bacterium]MBO0890815.1 site-2 protease family protein [Acidothermales bacterium]